MQDNTVVKASPLVRILQQQMPNRDDGVFYKGIIATCQVGKTIYELHAIGEACFRYYGKDDKAPETIYHNGDGEDGLAKILADGLVDGDLPTEPERWRNNNWFEILNSDTPDVEGEIVGNHYSEGSAAFREFLANKAAEIASEAARKATHTIEDLRARLDKVNQGYARYLNGHELICFPSGKDGSHPKANLFLARRKIGSPAHLYDVVDSGTAKQLDQFLNGYLQGLSARESEIVQLQDTIKQAALVVVISEDKIEAKGTMDTRVRVVIPEWLAKQAHGFKHYTLITDADGMPWISPTKVESKADPEYVQAIDSMIQSARLSKMLRGMANRQDSADNPLGVIPESDASDDSPRP